MATSPKVSVILDAVDNASSEMNKVGKSGDGLKDKFLALGKAVGVVGAVLGAGALFKKAIDEAMEAEKSYAMLETSLTNAGVSYAKAKPEVDALTAAIQKNTKYSADDARDALTNLITMTGDYEGSLKNLPLVLDIASKRNIDLGKASDIVAKGMDGNVKGLKALGIEIKAGVDPMEELTATYANFANREGATFGSRLEQIKNGWNDVLETVGLAIINNDAVTGSLGFVSNALSTLAGWVEQNDEGISSFMNVVTDGATRIYEFGRVIVESVIENAIKPLMPVIMMAKDNFLLILGAVQDVGGVLLDFAQRVIVNTIMPRIRFLIDAISPLIAAFQQHAPQAIAFLKLTLMQLIATLDMVIAGFDMMTGSVLQGLGELMQKGSGLLKKLGIDIGTGLADSMVKTGAEMQARAKTTITNAATLIEGARKEYAEGGKEARTVEKTAVEAHNKEMEQQEKDAKDARIRIAKDEHAAILAEIAANQPKMDAALAKQNEATKKAMQKLGREITTVIGDMLPPVIATTTHSIDQLRAAGEKALNPSQAISWKNALAQAEQVLDPVTGKIMSLADYTKKVADRSQSAAQFIKDFEVVKGVASDAGNLAAEFGIISEEANNALQHVISIADNLPALLTGDPTAILAVAGSLGSVLTGVFGTSADERERRRALKEVADGLEELARVNKGILELSAPGKDLRAAEKVLPDFIKSTERMIAAANRKDEKGFVAEQQKQAKMLVKAGLTQDQLFRMAQDLFGIDINKTGVEGLKGFLTGLGTTTDSSNPFGTGFAGEMERIRRQADAKDDDEADQFTLTETEKALRNFGGAGVGALFQGDVLKNLQGVLGMSGDQILDLADHLSPAEFLDTVQDMIELLRAAEEKEKEKKRKQKSAGDAGDDDGAPAAGFTDIDLPESMRGGTWHTDLLKTAMESRDSLGSLEDLFHRVWPESAFTHDVAGVGAREIGGIHIHEINFNISGVADEQRARAIGAELGDGFIRTINEKLGLQYDVDRFLRGDASSR